MIAVDLPQFDLQGALLHTGTPGTNREIYSEDADRSPTG